MQKHTFTAINEAEIRKHFEQGDAHLVFDVSGVIRFTRPFQIGGNTRIEVLPGRQIISTGERMWLANDDIWIEGWRSYVGNTSKQPDNADCFNIGNHGKIVKNATLIRSAGLLSLDGAIDMWGEKGGAQNRPTARNVTIRNCVFGFPMLNAGHSKGEHAMVALWEGLEESLIEYNLFIAGLYRLPTIRESNDVTLRHNLWYGYDGSNNYANSHRSSKLLYIGNRYIAPKKTDNLIAYKFEDCTDVALQNNLIELPDKVVYAQSKLDENSSATTKTTLSDMQPAKIDFSLYGPSNPTALEKRLFAQIEKREVIQLVNSLDDVPDYDVIEDSPPVEPTPVPEPLPQPQPEDKPASPAPINITIHIHVDAELVNRAIAAIEKLALIFKSS